MFADQKFSFTVSRRLSMTITFTKDDFKGDFKALKMGVFDGVLNWTRKVIFIPVFYSVPSNLHLVEVLLT